MSKNNELVITTTDERPISDIEKDLTEAGFKVDQVMSEIGCITGMGDDKVAKKLRAISGVADVSEMPPPIDIGPPDSMIS
jgi:hypothetical protein